MLLRVFFLGFCTVAIHGYIIPEEDPNLFEGDMILSPEEKKSILTGEYWNKATPLAATKQPWPRIIPYDLYGLKTNPVARNAIIGAIKEFHKHTCIRFIPRTTETAYLQFEHAGGCASMVGYVPGRKNSIALGPPCWTLGIAMHEILHSLGFHHEQSRPDRDKYIKVHMENVREDATNNFRKYGYDKIDSMGSPYDFESVMHYKGNTFAKHNTLAITTIDPSKQKLIGQRNGFSKQDLIQINKLYKCDEAPPMTIPPIPTLNPRCSDRYPHCDRYLFRCKLSSTDVWGKWARNDCKQTCNFCNDDGSGGVVTKPMVTQRPTIATTKKVFTKGTSSPCVDKLTSCKQSYCNLRPGFGKFYCRKTCSFC